MFTQLNQYHVVLEVEARVSAGPGRARRHLRPSAAGGTQVPLSVVHARVDERPTPLTINHQGQFPVGDAVVQPGARRVAGRGGRRRSRRRSRRSACRASIAAGFQGTAQAFQASLANEPLLILAALVTVYIVLGVLYESYIHPITILSTLPSAGVGALLALMLCRQRSQRHRADRHHPADRHREEERDHDDRLRARGRAQARASRRARRSTRPACCASARS